MTGLRFLAVLAFAMGTAAQIMAQPRTEISSFMHQLTIERSTGRTKISQWVTPITLHLPIAGGNIEMHSAGMFLHQTGQNTQSALGALDTAIKGRWRLGHWGLVNAYAVLPTGKGALDPQDDALVRSIARNDLNFPVKTFGQGLKTGAALSLVRHSGQLTMSFGGVFSYRGAYEPVSGIRNYNPGDEIAGSVGLDYTHGSWIVRTSATGTYHRSDRQDGVAVFRNGKQIMFQLGLLYTGRLVRLEAEAYEIVRLKNKDLTNGAFLYEARDSNGNDIHIRAKASWSLASFVTLHSLGDFKHITHNAHALGTPLYQGDAHLLEGGGGVALSFGPNHHLSVRATRLTGKAEDNTANLSALNIRGELSVLF